MQEEREAVVVFPMAYHQGFNHGFNMAEAVNFGSRRWLEYGKRARGCLCMDNKSAVKIDMAPFLQIYQPQLLNTWKQGDDFQLHPEDPDYLHKFLKDVREKMKNGRVTEGEWEEVKVTLRDIGAIPAWYEIRFGVRFVEQQEIVPMGAKNCDEGVGKSCFGEVDPVGQLVAMSGEKFRQSALMELRRQNAVLRVQRWWRRKKREEVRREETTAVLLSRPSKDGFARLDGHLSKIARLRPIFL